MGEAGFSLANLACDWLLLVEWQLTQRIRGALNVFSVTSGTNGAFSQHSLTSQSFSPPQVGLYQLYFLRAAADCFYCQPTHRGLESRRPIPGKDA